MKEADFDIKELPDNTSELKRIIENYQIRVNDYESQLNELKNQNKILEEKFLLLQHRFFGAKSEKFTKEEEDERYLFNEAEVGAEEEAEEPDEIVIKEHTRKKSGRKPIPPNFPRQEIIHDVPEEEKKCSCCGEERPKIESEPTEELDIIPPKIIVYRHIRLKYGPCKCEESKKLEEPEIITAEMPPRLIPYSIASPGLLSYIATAKFCDALPFYRQEKIFERIDVEIPRETMCRWMILLSRRCQDLLKLMWDNARGSPFVQMDETPFQVIDEPGRSPQSKSYMWVTIAHDGNKKLVIFHYHPTRSKEVPLEALKDFKGYLQTDGYAAYNDTGSQPGVIHVGCFAHARRYFNDALRLSKNQGSANKALSFIQKLYYAEKVLRQKYSDPYAFNEERKKEALPVLEEFYEWLKKKESEVAPKSKIGEAVLYTLGEWKKLIRYLDMPFLTPDNNIAENAIRPFVVGRKNWLFSYSPNGAHASACIYSLIESAKANKLEPYRYLRYIFTKIPQIKSIDELKMLLPTEIDEKLLYTV